MELTIREKSLLIEVLSQIQFKVGQSALAKEYESIVVKLQVKEEE